MAQKRMFDKAVIETDNFLNVSLTAKALYFLLGMEADDEGFVSPNRVMRLYGAEMGDLKNLIDTGLIIPFRSGVIVITDWKQNNWLDTRRIKPTQYQDEKGQLTITSQNKYALSNGLADAQPVERSIEERRGVEIAGKMPASTNDLIELFKEVNPTYTRIYKNKTERAALERLAKQFPHTIGDMIRYLPTLIAMPYAPKITTPIALERDMGKIKAFITQEKNKNATKLNAAKIAFL